MGFVKVVELGGACGQASRIVSCAIGGENREADEAMTVGPVGWLSAHAS